MTTTPEDDTTTRIESRGQFLAAVQAVLLALPAGEVRELRCVDADFGDWPLGAPEVVQALTTWLRRPGRRLRLLGLHFEDLQQRQARFARWRREWSHAVEVMRPTDVEEGDMPCLLLAGRERIEILDRARWRGVHTRSAGDAVLAAHRIDAISQRCEPAWPVDTLGL